MTPLNPPGVSAAAIQQLVAAEVGTTITQAATTAATDAAAAVAQAAADAIRAQVAADAARAEAAAATGQIASREAAQLLDILLPINRITVAHDGEALDYVRLPSGWDATYAPLTTFGGQKWMAAGTPSLRHHGGVGDGNVTAFTGTDNWQALNDLLKFVETNNAFVKAAHINAGTFLVVKNLGVSQAMRLHAFDITLTGEGEGVSVLVYRNSLVDATSRPFLFSNQPHGRVELRDFAVVSDWTLGVTNQDLGHIFALESFVGDLYADRIRIEGSCSMNLVVTDGGVVEVTNSTFIRSQRDGVHVSRNRKNRVDNCTFIDVCDDSISASYRLDSHLDTEAIFTNNFFYKSQGIHVGGARNIIVEGNIILMAPIRGIYVGYTNTLSYPDRGPIGRWSISVKNNQVQDVFGRSRFGGSGSGTGYIMVGDRGSSSAGARGFNQPVISTDGTHFVWGPDGAGGVVDPVDHMYEARNLIGNMNVIVEGNSCIRTLKPVASFASYGFGPLYVQDVGIYTGDIIEADFLNEHYLIGGTFRSLIVANNISRRANQPFRLEGPGQTAIPDFDGVVVRGNHAADYDATSAFRVDMTGIVELADNHVDGDPIHRSPARTATGGWTDAGAKYAYQVISGQAVIKGGTVKNVSAIYTGNAEVVSALTIHADAVSLGDNAGNLGVRHIPRGIPFAYVKTVSDPNLATFNQTLSVTKAFADGMPTSGHYLAGQVVAHAHPVIDGDNVINGWLRLRTGSEHVEGTDWRPIYADRAEPVSLAKASGVIRFGYLTDTHNRDFPPQGIRYFADAPAKTADAVATFRARDVDFIFHGGDVVQGYGTAAEDVADLDEIVGIIRTAGVPDYYVCGNHDLPRMSFAQFVATTGIPAQGYYHWDHKGVRFIALDTSYSADDDASHYNANDYATANKYVPPGERTWLAARLAEWNGRFVLFSHNPLSAQTVGNTYTSNADAVHAILAPYAARILAVISGHSHTNLQTIRDGVRYYEMEAATDNPYPANAYAVISIDGDNLAIEGFGGQSSWRMPAITSPSAVKGVEGYPLRHALTSDQAVTWRISGGADAGEFVIGGTNTLQFIGRTAPTGSQTYAVEVSAQKGPEVKTQAIAVQVIPVPTFDADLEALLAKSATEPSITHKIAYNDLLVALKTSGAWAKLVGFKLLAAHARDMALVDWKSAAYDMPDVPAIAWVPGRGFRGNGANSFAIAFNPRTPGTALYAQDSAAMGVMMEQFAGVSRGAFGNTNARIGYSSTGTLGTAAHSASLDLPSYGGNHAAWRRATAAGYDRFRDGVFVDTAAVASSLPTSANFTLMGAAGGFTGGLVNAAYWGSGTLTDAEMLAIDAALRAYFGSIGG